ncbi:MAG: hypothetical protein OXD43_08355 [Bacteroidetes bacterium]|nr:hypothetical protein [Bacteroidota bacterium]
MKRVTFLLGAGASIPAGYSSTHCLTERIRAPSGYYRHTDGRYYRGPPCPDTDFRTPLVRRIICWLYELTHEYLFYREESKEINYEDLYYLASQLRDDWSELQNPAMLPLIRNLKCVMISWPEYREFCERSGRTLSIPDLGEFHQLCEETCHYIEDIVVNVLSHDGQHHSKHLALITAIGEANDLDLKGIATLAHDTHVENFLSEHVSLADGFSPEQTDCGWRVWQDHFPEGSIPFLKLHGSTNWKKLRNDGNNNRSPETIGINMANSECSSPRPDEPSDPECWRRGFDRRPLLLIGTFNKPAMYTGPMLLDVHYRFRKILRNTDTLVVCGYSFGDKAINTQLIFWLTSLSGRSLVVIDPRCPSQIQKNARYATQKILNDRGTRLINEKMEDVCKDQLIGLLRGVGET